MTFWPQWIKKLINLLWVLELRWLEVWSCWFVVTAERHRAAEHGAAPQHTTCSAAQLRLKVNYIYSGLHINTQKAHYINMYAPNTNSLACPNKLNPEPWIFSRLCSVQPSINIYDSERGAPICIRDNNLSSRPSGVYFTWKSLSVCSPPPGS